jgi:hypothetical protein
LSLLPINCRSMEGNMSLLSRLFSSSDSKKTTKKAKNGNAQHDAGAGPALAAHSKDAKSSGSSGQNPAAAKKQGAASKQQAAKKTRPAAAKATPSVKSAPVNNKPGSAKKG